MTQSPIVAPRAVPPINIAPSGEQVPLQDVLVELWQNLEKLVRQEISLASAELDVKAQKLKREVAAAAIGAGLMLAGTLALVAAVILVLALFMPAWIASLITGAVAAGGGFVLIKANKPNIADVTPERTIKSLSKDIQAIKESIK